MSLHLVALTQAQYVAALVHKLKIEFDHRGAACVSSPGQYRAAYVGYITSVHRLFLRRAATMHAQTAHHALRAYYVLRVDCHVAIRHVARAPLCLSLSPPCQLRLTFVGRDGPLPEIG